MGRPHADLHFGQLSITQSVMITRQTLFLQGQQKSQITKSRRTHALQKNLFKTDIKGSRVPAAHPHPEIPKVPPPRPDGR